MKSILFLKNLYLLQSVNSPASMQADRIHTLFNYFNIAAGAMLLLVIFLVTYICIKFRHKKGDSNEPVQTSNNKLLEAAMIGGPTLLLIFFFYQTLAVMNAVSPSVLGSKLSRRSCSYCQHRTLARREAFADANALCRCNS